MFGIENTIVGKYGFLIFMISQTKYTYSIVACLCHGIHCRTLSCPEQSISKAPLSNIAYTPASASSPETVVSMTDTSSVLAAL